ncbi:MAG: KH domain-containing protein, partial [Candidatus Nanohaloarchaea archaeon]|nr:KH domain-containing protein [Candidatus Nanohaloarchaea archaeon]
MRHLRIPEERVSVLIGEDGETLEEVQELTGTEIEVEDGKVEIEGDPLEEIRAFNIVKAIGRGFSPERALRLLEDNTDLCVIDVSEFAPTDNAKERLKGRVIGRDGETRAKIEK